MICYQLVWIDVQAFSDSDEALSGVSVASENVDGLKSIFRVVECEANQKMSVELKVNDANANPKRESPLD